MDLNKAKKSSRVEDRTGDNELQRFLNYMLVMLNPVYAYRNIRNGGATPASDGVNIRKPLNGYSKTHGEEATY